MNYDIKDGTCISYYMYFFLPPHEPEDILSVFLFSFFTVSNKHLYSIPHTCNSTLPGPMTTIRLYQYDPIPLHLSHRALSTKTVMLLHPILTNQHTHPTTQISLITCLDRQPPIHMATWL